MCDIKVTYLASFADSAFENNKTKACCEVLSQAINVQSEITKICQENCVKGTPSLKLVYNVCLNIKFKDDKVIFSIEHAAL